VGNPPSMLPYLVAALALVLAVFAGAAFDSLLKGCFELRRSLRATSYNFDSVLLKSTLVPPASVLCLAFDASEKSRGLVRRLLDFHFGKHEVVLVLNAPTPEELACWTREFHLYRLPRVMSEIRPTAPIRGCYVSSDPIRFVVLDKEAGSVADGLNAAVNAAQFPIIGLVDAEAEFIPECMLRMIRPMLADWDRTMAVCGVAPPDPAPGLAGSLGALEALRLWLGRCAALSAWNRLLPVPGACMLVKREAIAAVGGFRGGITALFLELHAANRTRAPRQTVAFVATPVSARPAAATWSDLRRQATRDQRQLGAAMRQLGPGPVREFLGLYCIRGLWPLVETAAYLVAAYGWISGAVPPDLAALVLVVSVGGGIVTSMAAVVLRELAEPSGVAPEALGALCLLTVPENLGYRQVRNLWLIAGFFAGLWTGRAGKRGEAE